MEQTFTWNWKIGKYKHIQTQCKKLPIYVFVGTFCMHVDETLQFLIIFFHKWSPKKNYSSAKF